MIHGIDSRLITNILGVFLVIYLPIIMYLTLQKSFKVEHDPELD